MDDYDALKRVIDVCNRSDKPNTIITLIEDLYNSKCIPENVLGYDVISYAYNKAKQYKKALHYGEMALEAAQGIEQKLAVMTNVAKIGLAANEPEKCVKYYEYILDHLGDEEKLYYLIDYSAALFACNEKEKSYEILKSLEDHLWRFDQKTVDSILFNFGVHFISQGDFKRGMEHLYIGRKLNVFGSYSKVSDIPEWNRKPKENLHVLMVGEGGIGDEIVNVRFVKHLKELGLKCSLMSAHGLKSIYDHLPFEKVITVDEYDKKDYDCWTPVMGLPHNLSLDADQLWYGPYLKAKPEYIEKFSNIITGDFKVGVRWAGNPMYDHELHRTVSLEKIIESVDPSWSLYSVQRDVGMSQLEPFKDKIVDLSPNLIEFEDLLAALSQFDLLVTSCTSVVHAAAALGKKVIVMVPVMEYYIWAEGKKHSSWYGDNVTIIRQSIPRNWDQPYEELKEICKEISSNN